MIKLFTNTRYIPLILWLLIRAATAAPGPDSASFYIQHFTSENGLPQNSVKSIARGPEGFIWMTTEGGLVRFDGRTFKTYTNKHIPVESNRMRHLVRGLESGNLYAIAENDQLIRIAGPQLTLLPKVNKAFSSFLIPSGKSVTAYRSVGMPTIFAENITTETRYQLPLDSRCSFLVDLDTVRYYESKQEQWSVPFPNKNYWHFFALNEQLYYLNKDASVTLIRQDTLQTFPLEGDIRENPAYESEKPVELYWNAISGDVFLYLNKCFYLLEEYAGGRLDTRLILSGFDFDRNNVYSVHYDKENERLFLGSQTKGLFVIKRKSFRTLTAGKAGRGNEIYYAQTVYQGNKVLTGKGTILGPEGFTGRLPLVARYNDSYSLLTDSIGNIWTKKQRAIYKLSPDGRLIGEFTLPDEVSQLYQGQNGNIWIGTVHSGLYYLRPREKEAQHIISTKAEISYMIQDAENTLWIGTKSGLYKLLIPEMKLDSIGELDSTYIRSVYPSGPGEVWLTTAENGIYLYKDDRLTHFPLDKKSYLANSHCILEDDKGCFWITTNQGLFQAVKKDLLDFADKELDHLFYFFYGKAAGFNTNEFNGGCQPCGIVLENGYFSFPSLNGLVLFRPGEVREELPLNDIYIDEIEIDSTVRAVEDTLRLDSHFNRMQLFFTSPYFGNPYNLSFKYRLKGPSGSNDWLEVSGDKVISFSAMPSGTYHLIIRKQNGFNAFGYTDKQLVIIIPRFFYETWWFKALVALAAALAVLFYIRLRMNSIKRRNEELEERIVERTLKLKQTIFAQQASKEKLRQQNYLQQRLLAAITHDIKSPLQYLTLTAKTIYEHYPQKNGNIKDDMERIYRSSSRVFHFTENLVQYMKVNMAGSRLDNEEAGLFNLISEKIEIFSEMSESKGNKIENTIDRNISIRTNEQLLGIVIHNLLDNAVKFTRSGYIRFSGISDGRNYKIILEDTGRGMDDEMVAWCNTFGTIHNGEGPLSAYKGLGLTIVMELLAMIDGKLHAVKTTRGTRIELIL